MTKREAARVLGLKPEEFTDLRLHSTGIGVKTWQIRLKKDVPDWGKAGDDALFPVLMEQS